MEWLQPRRRGPEWKQGWTERTLTSISAPSIHLLTVFLIVIFLLWCSSSYSEPRPHLRHSVANLHILLVLSPILAIFLLALYTSAWRFTSGSRSSLNAGLGAARPGGSSGAGIPWGVAFAVGLLLVLISYHSSFQSKWFGSLREWDICGSIQILFVVKMVRESEQALNLSDTEESREPCTYRRWGGYWGFMAYVALWCIDV